MCAESNPVDRSGTLADRAVKVELFARASAFEHFLFATFEEAHPFMLFGVDDGDEGEAVDMTDIYNGLSSGLLGELWPDDNDLDCDEYRAAVERAHLLTASLFQFALSQTDVMRHEVERWLANSLQHRAPQLPARRAA